jgi:chromosome partitioning protein
MKTLAIANHKGGTGKTATARTLGDILSRDGVRCLMLDLDPQSSLTMSCKLDQVEPNLSDVLGGAQPGKVPLAKVTRKVKERLYIAPGNLSLAGSELGMHARLTGREFVLAKALEQVKGEYDLALIDCPPSLSLLVINALMAADAVLIPTQPMPVDVAGVRLFLDTVEAMRVDRPQLRIFGILPTFYDDRLNAHKAAIEAMETRDWPVLPIKIGRSVRVGESAAMGESILTFEPGSVINDQYKELGRAIKLWLEK